MPYFPILIWIALILFWPGICIRELTRVRWPEKPRSTNFQEQLFFLPEIFALSLAVLSATGWISFGLNLRFQDAQTLTLAIIAGLTLIPIWRFRRRRDKPVLRFDRERQPLEIIPFGLLALVILLIAVYGGIWVSNTADMFYHLQAARSLILSNRAMPQQIFFSIPVPGPDPTAGSWHFAIALIANLVGSDVLPVARVVNPLLASPLALAFAALVWTMSRSSLAAFTATVLYLSLGKNLDFRAVVYPNQLGHILIWLTIAYLLRYARPSAPDEGQIIPKGRTADLAFALLIVFTASSVHLGLISTIYAVLGVGLAFATLQTIFSRFFIPRETGTIEGDHPASDRSAKNLFFSRKSIWPFNRKLYLACGLSILVSLPVFAYKTLVYLLPYSSRPLQAEISYPVTVVRMPWGLQGIDLSFWFPELDSIAVLATVLALGFIVRSLKNDLAATFLLGSVLAVPLLAWIPIISTSYLSTYAMFRITGFLEPFLYAAWGWQLARGLEVLASFSTARKGSVWRSLIFLAVLAVSLPIAWNDLKSGLLLLYQSKPGQENQLTVSKKADLSVRWADRKAFIKLLPPDSVILADPDISYELAGLTGIPVVAVSPSHTPIQDQYRDGPERWGNALDVLAGAIDPARLAGIMELYHVNYVLVDAQTGDGPLAMEKLPEIAILEPVAGGEDWQLYRYRPDRLGDYLQFRLQPHFYSGSHFQTGLAPEQAIAGRILFAALKWDKKLAGSAQLVAKGLRSGREFGQAVQFSEVIDQPQIFPIALPRDLPIDWYQLSLKLGEGQDFPVGKFAVGWEYQAEFFRGILGDRDYDYAQLYGWTSYRMPFYFLHRAAILVNGMDDLASLPIPELPFERYRLLARVWDSGNSGTNGLEVRVGENRSKFKWSGAESGARWLEQLIEVKGKTQEISFKATMNGQGAVILDTLVIFPEPGQ